MPTDNIEEARLIYLGVTQRIAGADAHRLVSDIGVGGPELIIREGRSPLRLVTKHPLTYADLQEEAQCLQKAGFDLLCEEDNG